MFKTETLKSKSFINAIVGLIGVGAGWYLGQITTEIALGSAWAIVQALNFRDTLASK